MLERAILYVGSGFRASGNSGLMGVWDFTGLGLLGGLEAQCKASGFRFALVSAQGASAKLCALFGPWSCRCKKSPRTLLHVQPACLASMQQSQIKISHPVAQASPRWCRPR